MVQAVKVVLLAWISVFLLLAGCKKTGREPHDGRVGSTLLDLQSCQKELKRKQGKYGRWQHIETLGNQSLIRDRDAVDFRFDILLSDSGDDWCGVAVPLSRRFSLGIAYAVTADGPLYERTLNEAEIGKSFRLDEVFEGGKFGKKLLGQWKPKW